MSGGRESGVGIRVKKDSKRPQNPESRIPFWHPASLISTCFGIGKIPFAPGTWGSLFGLLIVLLKYLFLWFFSATVSFAAAFGSGQRYDFTSNYWIHIACLAALISISKNAVVKYLQFTDKSDPQEIVIDEVVGVMIGFDICYLIVESQYDRFLGIQNYATSVMCLLLLSFLFFRFFDIVKPGPVGWADRNVKGAWGVMLDDIIAGVLAGICSALVFLAI